MKNALVQVLIYALLLLAGYQLGRYLTKKHYEKQIDEIVTIYTGEDKSDIVYGAAEGLELNSENAVIVDVEGNNADISVLSAPKNLCARFSATGCRPCIDTMTSALQAFAAENPDWHINLLIDNIPLRDMYVLSKEFGKSFSLYSADRVSAELGNEVSPVIFRVSPEGRVFRHFTCSPDAPERTRAYVATAAL